MRISKRSQSVRSVDDWFRHAPPKGGAKHWVAGRSARALAEAWFPVSGEPTVPFELSQLLSSNAALGTPSPYDGEPECLVRFDGLLGGLRNCDLLIMAESPVGPLAISIEAKADETFGRTVGQELDALRRARHAGKRRNSNIRSRIEGLGKALFDLQSVKPISGIRYQLMHGVAAALAAAHQRKASAAAFVVHEFVTDATHDREHESNAKAFQSFVTLLARCEAIIVTAGRLLGPFKVPGNERVPEYMPLYIGKAVRNMRRPS